MTDYSQMSDFEINKAVADIVMNGTWHVTPSHPDNKTGGWLYGSNGIQTYPLPDYCNSWADAGPIIEKNGIGIYFIGEGHHRGKWGSDAPGGRPYVYGDSLLRNAMIVFLMMQDSSNANPI
ncbi:MULTISPECIES: phage protein NinX family protein [unclassified Cedecea]|uniref:phage protein NinX family protein n=1 Tax=unclassified Cedecea TaxID=2649846 RepID=UPI0030161CF0